MEPSLPSALELFQLPLGQGQAGKYNLPVGRQPYSHHLCLFSGA